jgi:hypothetical protein
MWPGTLPGRYPQTFPQAPEPVRPFNFNIGVSQVEFDKLKAEVEELKKLLLAAKKFDEATDQVDCEMDEKIALITKIAKAVGVDMADVFAKHVGK